MELFVFYKWRFDCTLKMPAHFSYFVANLTSANRSLGGEQMVSNHTHLQNVNGQIVF